MRVDISGCLAAYLAGNRGLVPGAPDASRPADYGVSAILDGGVIRLTLTFRAGSAYCCRQPGCHLDIPEDGRWGRLRRALSADGLAPTSRLTIRLTILVEDGALFFDFSRPDPGCRGRYAFAPATGSKIEAVLVEGRLDEPE
ncbi:hypothetical protein [Tautonia plasticadhaerens]|uniref:Uncharacterized protein n=1 Tax=Tautonia plasticadhaerens TaxID=2527974 RepID=A0A518GV36_9BACT|nr:hypothetical protein [Tautonia plasticadhaerens]QDV32447.1 hypothetical protein ElP_02790 [Tautonia plasticadhaerens]